MADQNDIWGGTEFSGGAMPSANKSAPASVNEDADNLWAGTELSPAAPPNNSKGVSSATGSSSPIVQIPKDQPKEMSWEDVGQQAIKNIGPSAYEFGHSIYETVAHPLDTASAIGTLGTGAYSKAKTALGYQPTAEEKKSEASVDTLANFYKSRYGSMAGFKEAVSNDPVGILADLMTPFTGGETGAAKATSLLGKTGEAIQGVARAADPLNIATQIPKKITETATSVANLPLSLQSGVSYRSLQQAVQAGMDKNPVFWQHATGAAPASDAISAVKQAIGEIAQDRSNAYLNGMSEAQKRMAGAPLSYDAVDAAMRQNLDMVAPKGLQFDPNSSRAQLNSKLENLIDAWKKNPNNDHSMFAFDQLKQGVRQLGFNETYAGTPERAMIDNLANAAKNTIPDAGYRETMDAYGKATQNLNDLNRDLVAGKSTGAQIRKLLKDQDAAHKSNLLEQIFAKNEQIPFMLAGQEVATTKPGSLAGQLASSLGAYGAYAYGSPIPLAVAAASSPKIVARLGYGAGRVGGLPAYLYENYPKTAKSIYQAGHAEDVLNANPQATQRQFGGRTSRATGGRTNGVTTADMLIAAAERAKKNNGKATEALLHQPDEVITHALAIANKQN